MGYPSITSFDSATTKIGYPDQSNLPHHVQGKGTQFRNLVPTLTEGWEKCRRNRTILTRNQNNFVPV